MANPIQANNIYSILRADRESREAKRRELDAKRAEKKAAEEMGGEGVEEVEAGA